MNFKHEVKSSLYRICNKQCYLMSFAFIGAGFLFNIVFPEALLERRSPDPIPYRSRIENSQPLTNSPTIEFPITIFTFGDINRDGVADLVLVPYFGGGITYRLGEKDSKGDVRYGLERGNIGEVPNFMSQQLLGASITDVTNDGTPDLLFSNGSSINYLEGYINQSGNIRFGKNRKEN